MKFWRWYFRGIWRLAKLTSKMRLRHLASLYVEYMVGAVLLAVGVPSLTITGNPRWLFLAVPVGTTVIAHSAYRGMR